MNIKISTLSLVALALAISAPQVFALDIDVDSRGTVRFYNGEVLGMTQESENNRRFVSPSKVVAPNNGSLHLRTNNSGVEVQLQNHIQDDAELQTSETIHSDEFRMQFPSVQEFEDNPDTYRGTNALNEDSNRAGSSDAVNQAQQNQNDDVPLSEQELYLKQLRENRQERTEEMIQIKNQAKEKAHVIEIESRGVQAMIDEGAEISYNPETNDVIIITPSGEEQTLTHLPDQAIERMSSLGLLNSLPENADNIKIEVSSDGQLQYVTADYQDKKLFGVIHRRVPTEVVLKDATGEVIETEKPARTFLSELLNMFSF